jgi:hypothetical protein
LSSIQKCAYTHFMSIIEPDQHLGDRPAHIRRKPMPLALRRKLQRDEKYAATILLRVQSDRALDQNPNYCGWAYRHAASRLSRVCSITGESFTTVCERLGIAPGHRPVLADAVAETLAAPRKRSYLVTPAGRVRAKTLQANETFVKNTLNRIRPDAPEYNEYFAAALRIARICFNTGWGFRKVCNRLGVSPHHKPFLAEYVVATLEELHNPSKPKRAPFAPNAPKSLRKYEDYVRSVLRHARSDRALDQDPNDWVYPAAAVQIRLVSSVTKESFEGVCDRLLVAARQRPLLLNALRLDPDVLRKFRVYL